MKLKLSHNMSILQLKLTFTLLLSLICTSSFGQKLSIKDEFAFAEQQIKGLLKAQTDSTLFPFSVNRDGSMKNMPSSWWCSGFFPGLLWYLYEYTGKPEWRSAAERWTEALEQEQFNTQTHDLGFMLYCSYGNGARLTDKPGYAKVLQQGAASLASRYDPKIGLIKSWDKFENYNFPVIIDNMMNLEFLLWAAKYTGRDDYRQICIKHADQTLENQFRPDASCYHVVCYDRDGKVLAKKNHQGYKDDSSWSRGQAWALYGYTIMYRETRQEKYLRHAERVASFILNHPNLPKDKIPYWDYNAPDIPNEERDVSAAAVTASALLELQNYTSSKRQYYIKSAREILQHLSSPAYRAAIGGNNNFLLMHSVSAKTLGKEIDKPLIYADYYYLEALLKLDVLEKNNTLKN